MDDTGGISENNCVYCNGSGKEISVGGLDMLNGFMDDASYISENQCPFCNGTGWEVNTRGTNMVSCSYPDCVGGIIEVPKETIKLNKKELPSNFFEIIEMIKNMEITDNEVICKETELSLIAGILNVNRLKPDLNNLNGIFMVENNGIVVNKINGLICVGGISKE